MRAAPAIGRALLILATQLLGCESKGYVPSQDDVDGDGVALPYDCDDADAEVYPGAAERCDGVDQNCDTEIDENPIDGVSWYLDQDGDGYGVGDYARVACLPVEDEVGIGDDCNDQDDEISPLANELCDDVDNDCDGEVDEGDATDAREWFPDEDGDGEGADINPWPACVAPDGYVRSNDDCDDGNPRVNSDADEVCDGLDNDCDGAVDADSVDDTRWYQDSDGDGFGWLDGRSWACEAPDGYVGSGTDCDDTNDAISPLADELCDLVDNDCDGETDEDAIDPFTWYPDDDGDGYGDPSSPYAREACAPPAGYSWEATDCDDTDAQVSPGSPDVCGSEVDEDCDGVADDCTTAVLIQGASAARVGYALASAGDLNGDGLDDVWVGADGASAIYGLFTPLDGGDALIAPALTWSGAAGEGAGAALAGGEDLDGDGLPELAVGAPDSARGGDAAGAAWLVLGGGAGGDLEDADAWLVGGSDGLALGAALALGGDLDGDGLGELGLALPGDDRAAKNAGAVLLFLGVPSGGLESDDADATLLGEGAGDAVGDALLLDLDLDADGLDDLVIGASRATQDDLAEGETTEDGIDGKLLEDAGRIYLSLGPVSGSLSLTDADAILGGHAPGIRAGQALLAPGDLNGDGSADLIVGAPFADGEALGAGAVYLLHGPLRSDTLDNLAAAIVLGPSADAAAGWALASGDVNGDGEIDLWVGSPYDADAGEEAGCAWLVYGGFDGERWLTAADARVLGDAAGDQLGWALEMAGDRDGDGLGDLIFAAPMANDAAGDVGIVTGF